MRTQTVLVLPHLVLELRRPTAEIPNTEGFLLLGVLPNKLAIPLRVAKDEHECHYLVDQHNARRSTSEFIGWLPDDPKEKPSRDLETLWAMRPVS